MVHKNTRGRFAMIATYQLLPALGCSLIEASLERRELFESPTTGVSSNISHVLYEVGNEVTRRKTERGWRPLLPCLSIQDHNPSPTIWPRLEVPPSGPIETQQKNLRHSSSPWDLPPSLCESKMWYHTFRISTTTRKMIHSRVVYAFQLSDLKRKYTTTPVHARYWCNRPQNP